MPELLALLRVPVGMRAVNTVEVLREPGDVLLQAQGIGMRIRDEQHLLVGLAHGLEEVPGTRQVFDPLVVVPVQLHHVEFQALAPVVQAVPVQFALYLAILGEQPLARLAQCHAVLLGPALGHVGKPHEVVVGEIEDRTVHVEHQSLAVGQRGFRIE